MTTEQWRSLQLGLGALLLVLFVGGSFGMYSRSGGGALIFLGAAFGVGVVIGRWWALVVAFIPVLVAPPLDHPEGSVVEMLLISVVVILLPVVAAGIVTGMGVQRWVRPTVVRPSPPT